MEIIYTIDWKMTLAVFVGVYILLWVLRPVIKLHWIFEAVVLIAAVFLANRYWHIIVERLRDLARFFGLEV